jgi:hypothetical protein
MVLRMVLELGSYKGHTEGVYLTVPNVLLLLQEMLFYTG